MPQTFLIWLHSSSTEWNKPARAGLEIASFVLINLLGLAAAWDFFRWVQERVNGRRLSTPPLAPPTSLYKIPGEHGKHVFKP